MTSTSISSLLLKFIHAIIYANASSLLAWGVCITLHEVDFIICSLRKKKLKKKSRPREPQHYTKSSSATTLEVKKKISFEK
jgi:hypothetical protein